MTSSSDSCKNFDQVLPEYFLVRLLTCENGGLEQGLQTETKEIKKYFYTNGFWF